MRLIRLWPDDSRFDFMRFRRFSFPLSALLSVLTVILLLTVGLNFGIDFKGGTLMELQAKSGHADVGKVRETANGFGFGDVAERYSVLNEKLIESDKKTGKAAVDGYQKTVASYVDFRQQLAEATQLDWVTTVVKAQNDFLTEVNAAYVSAARDVLK